MFSKAKKEVEVVARSPGRNPPSIISASLRIIGNLVSDGDIQVDGMVDGDVQSQTLTISQGAAVNGGITAQSVRIDGMVNGHIRAASVVLGASARVLGDVVHSQLVVEAGAFLEGHCRRIEAEAAPMAAVAAVVSDEPEKTPLYSVTQ